MTLSLQNCDPNQIPFLEPVGRFEARVISVYDGDTVTLIHEWSGRFYKVHVRLIGIDAPELKPRINLPGRQVVIKQAQAARDYLKTLVEGKLVDYVAEGWDKYGGRMLGRLWVSGQCVNELMLKVEGVKPYNGGAKN